MLTYRVMILPDKKLEEKLWRRGLKFIVGVDEAGRGPLAGPVVVGAVMLKPESELIEGVRDSKKLSKNQRELLYKAITENYSWGVGVVSAHVIDRIGIKEAVRQAMIAAIETIERKIDHSADYIISDGAVYLIEGREMLSINHGDLHHYSISAASIIAKVTRDRIMERYAKKYPQYLFEKNVGYGTKEHLDAIKRYGISDIHRRSYAPIRKAL